MDFNKIQQKLEALKQKPSNNFNDSGLIWKPTPGDNDTPGEHIIRILPWPIVGSDKPFLPLYFYYKKDGMVPDNWLSPFSFDEPDPVIEFSNKLKGKSGSKEEVSANWKLAKKLEPKIRIYVPILVRGKEEEGVKFWGFGVQIYRVLDELFDDPDWGNLADLNEGRDIKVVYTPAANKESYPDTSVTPKPKQVKATENPDVLKKIQDMPDIMKIFKKPTYDELKDALGKYLNGGSSENSEPKSEIQTPAVPDGDSQKPSDPRLPDLSDIEDQFEKMLRGEV